jgi:RHS repeat-associated protein
LDNEFGTARADATALASVGPNNYGYLGAKRRDNNALAGLTLMGERVYNPLLGRFLQTDPVPGGSCNSYEYACQDPVNLSDLAGTKIGFGKHCQPGRHCKVDRNSKVDPIAFAKDCSFVPGLVGTACALSVSIADLKQHKYLAATMWTLEAVTSAFGGKAFTALGREALDLAELVTEKGWKAASLIASTVLTNLENAFAYVIDLPGCPNNKCKQIAPGSPVH